MNKLFENVKFGDRFLTRDGKVVVYSRPGQYGTDQIIFYTHETEGSWGETVYCDNGQYYGNRTCGRDIVERLTN